MKHEFLKALENTLKSSDIAHIKDGHEYLFRKVITPCVFEDDLKILEIQLSPNTRFYAEGFQMLSQSHGTFENVVEIGRCPDDREPYEKRPNYNYKTAYNYIIIRNENEHVLLGFTSCTKYTGYFKIYPSGLLQFYMSLEGQSFRSGDVIESEFFTILQDTNKSNLLNHFGKLIQKHHHKLPVKQAPIGWCFWYWYSQDISENDIHENLELSKNKDFIKYIQIDDGYQTHMGDWLSFSDKFPNGLENLIKEIHSLGKEPAIWVAPFIASPESTLVKEHPDWFVRDDNGNILTANDLTYGGWRDTPWCLLDFTQKEVNDYICRVFTYFKHELGIIYFKFDACYCGAIKGCKFKNNVSRIYNYRTCLKMILDTVGSDGFILGCNAPLWPSLGLVHAMRVSDDIERKHHRIKQLGLECLHRNWMNSHLWTIDPDCLCFKDLRDQKASKSDYRFHLATILLSNGVLMLGDRLSELTDKEYRLLEKILLVKKSDVTISFDNKYDHFYIKNNKTNECIDVYLNWSYSIKTIYGIEDSLNYLTEERLPEKVELNGLDALIVKVN